MHKIRNEKPYTTPLLGLKLGDIVIVKGFNEMAEEFGFENGNKNSINVPFGFYRGEMENFCYQEFIVDRLEHTLNSVAIKLAKIDENGEPGERCWPTFSEQMLIPRKQREEDFKRMFDEIFGL